MSASLLIKGAQIVSMDDQIGVRRGDILVEDDRIAEIAPHIQAPDDAEIIDASGKIAVPGFVNAHIHTWQTGLRGIAADWTISEYLRAMHAGLATFFKPEDIYIANLTGALNQLHCGTTTIVDWCHNNPTPEHTDAAIEGLQQSGIRALFLHGSPKPDPKPGQKHFSEIPMPANEVARIRKGQLSSDDALVTMGLAILGPDFGTWEVCDADFRLARDLDMVASMHVTGLKKTPDGFRRLADAGLLGNRFNIVHGNTLSDEELAMLTGHGVTFTLTPEVEMQMSFGRPLTGRLRKLGAPVTLGSDIESSMTGDMFTVARMALQAQRFIDCLDAMSETGKGLDRISITCADALRWITIDGARMAGLDHRIGSLTPGKQADILLLSASDPNMFPVVDPVASVMMQAGIANVDTVMVGGVVRKRDGKLVASHLQKHYDALAASSERIVAASLASMAAH
jgi:cytosine/adenosine deaminase-related metal-dependent hydrolase